MFKLLSNAAGFQIVWFTCALTVQNNPPHNVIWVCIVTLLFLLQHVYFSGKPKTEIILVLKVSLLGWLLDTLLVQNHLIYFEGSYPGSFSKMQPFWMTCLWLSLGASLNASLSWLKPLLSWSSLIGAVVGTLSYLAGAKFGVLRFESTIAIAITAICWGIALPILIMLSIETVDTTPPLA